MKKLILTVAIALVAVLTSCKKQELNNEWYSVKYQTLNDTLKIEITGSNGINAVNALNPSFQSKDALGVISTTVQGNLIKYVVPLNGNQKVNLDFKKLDGIISTLEMQKNGALLNTRIK